MGNSVFMCKMALTNYSMAYYLEMLLSESTDSEYIRYVKKEINKKVVDHKELSVCYDREVCDFFEQTTAYSPNKFLNLFLASGMSAGTIFIANPLLGAAIVAAINSKSESDKKDAKDKIEKAFNDSLVQCRDTRLFAQIEAAIDEYDRIVNKRRARLVVTEEHAYIKFEADK